MAQFIYDLRLRASQSHATAHQTSISKSAMAVAATTPGTELRIPLASTRREQSQRPSAVANVASAMSSPDRERMYATKRERSTLTGDGAYL